MIIRGRSALAALIITMTLCGSFSELHASLLVDNAETGTNKNVLGGSWLTFNDGFSETTFTPNFSPGYAGNYCRLFEWTIKTGSTTPYAGITTSLNASWNGVNLSSYYGVRFYAKGNGRYDISLATDKTRAGNNHYVKSINMTSDWTLYELPFSQFAQTWGQSQPWDPSTIYAFGAGPVASIGMSGQIWMDNIEFYLESEAHPVSDPNQIIPEPKVNQVGYLPDDKKYFCVVSDHVAAGDAFQILDSQGNSVFSGSISGNPVNDVESTGEHVWKIDFSDLNTGGTYNVQVNDQKSYPFTVSDSIYNPLFKDALRCFYLIRCGLAENDPVSGINRPACHMNDAKIRGGTGTIDATGGWHNAGDKGKYTNETAISVAYMLWIYELKSPVLKELNNNIPESGNGMSDLLNEARWGLQWLLKMQTAVGTVYHKVDSEPYLLYCPEQPPDLDPFDNLRYAAFQKSDEPQNPSTIDAADFTGVMSQAARVFQAIDPAFAAQCLDAAKKSWSWVSAHPSVGQTDPAYVDSDALQEYLWAEAEMARTLDSNDLRSHFNNDINRITLAPVGWGDPQLFGYMAMYYDHHTDAALSNKIKTRLVTLCNEIVNVSESTGYGVALQSWEYWWESNEWVMNKANCLLFGYELTGNAVYRKTALSQLNYILGLNSLNKSFVMGYGSHFMMHPFNCIYTVYGKSFPGWMAGGPNSYLAADDVFQNDLIQAGTPKAKCYADKAECGLGSWSTNEGETCENAALVFLAGYFFKGFGPPFAPQGLQGNAVSPSQIRVSWNAASGDVLGYVIESFIGNSFQTIAQMPGIETTFLDTGLRPSTSYRYRIKAYNSYGYSESSQEVQAATTAGGTGPVVLALNAGGDTVQGHDGVSYAADGTSGWVTGGTVFSTTASIAGTEDDALYQTERWGDFSYQIPLQNGLYDVVLKFAEIYQDFPGIRIFDVDIEGTHAIQNFDIYLRTGKNTAYDVVVPVEISDAVLNIQFISRANSAKLSGLEVRRTGTSGVEAPPAQLIPNTYFMDQNYPNPFNAGTRIVFGLPRADQVTLTVYNIQGQTVCILFSGFAEAGVHRIDWQASGLVSGVYILKLKTPHFEAIRKMFFQK